MCSLLLILCGGVVALLPYPLLVVFTTCGTIWPWPWRPWRPWG